MSTVTIKGSSLFMSGKAKIGTEINIFFNVSNTSFASYVLSNGPVFFLNHLFL